jgi:hypothetical protein
MAARIGKIADLKAKPKVDGITVTFDDGSSAPANVPYSIQSYDDDEIKNSENFLTLLLTMKKIPVDEDSSEPLVLKVNQTFNAVSAWEILKQMMANYFFDGSPFKAAYKADTSRCRVRSEVRNVLEKRKRRLDTAVASVKGKTYDYNQLEPDPEFAGIEDREKSSPMNMIDLKSIIDQINVAATTIANKGVSPNTLARHEPPFFPRLSEGERLMVWNWVKAKQRAVEEIYNTPLFRFATKVAGLTNMSFEMGVDKLITSAYKQSTHLHRYKEMPVTIADDPFLSVERDLLFDRIVSLNAELEKSKIRDLLEQQQRENVMLRRPEKAGDKNYYENQKVFFKTQYEAFDDEVPIFSAKGFTKVVENDEPVPISQRTRELEERVSALGGMTKAYQMESSRQRMMWAIEWMMQPEILRSAELSPLFTGAISAALFRLRSQCPSLRMAHDASMYYESPDVMAADALAELVAMQITRIKFFHPTRAMLDKTNARNQQMEHRLINRMKNFVFDGTYVLSDVGSDYPSSSDCAALYAF